MGHREDRPSYESRSWLRSPRFLTLCLSLQQFSPPCSSSIMRISLAAGTVAALDDSYMRTGHVSLLKTACW